MEQLFIIYLKPQNLLIFLLTRFNEHLVLDLFFVQKVLCFAAKLTALTKGLKGLLLVLLLLMLDAADVLMRVKEGGALSVVVLDFGVCKG